MYVARALAFATLVACASDSVPEVSVVRDSSGVRIVELPDLRFADTLSWTVDSLPAVQFGGAAGTAKSQFGNIVGVTRLSDGRIVALDAMHSELRFFSSDGSFLFSAGGAGGGPGEFQDPLKLLRADDDSLIVMDQQGIRFHVFTGDGKHVRTFGAKPPREENARPGPYPRAIARFNDGSLLFEQEGFHCLGIKMMGGGVISIPETAPGGFCEDSSTFTRVMPDSVLVARYGVFPTVRKQTITLVDGTDVSLNDLLPTTLRTAAGGGFLFADPTESELHFHGGEGGLIGIVRMQQNRLPMSVELGGPPPPDTASAEEKRFHRMLQAATSQLTLPRYAPAFLSVTPDRMGNIWVRPGISSDTAEALAGLRQWVVLDDTGNLKGVLRTSAALLIPALYDMKTVEIGDDYILAVRRDSLDVQEVVLHRLRRE